ncbi:hypothetical protein M5C96_02315 [Acidovorax sp. GBBC 1281]|nr:hypothetical protein [Acidovorax sp. GBBC 1281]WCM98322.1 hypothetical protein M5C96_02315 [Acidovorax sp. GBBC 1281]
MAKDGARILDQQGTGWVLRGSLLGIPFVFYNWYAFHGIFIKNKNISWIRLLEVDVWPLVFIFFKNHSGGCSFSLILAASLDFL